VANVYAPCEGGAKQRLWDSLSARLQVLRGMRVCVCGDFNAVRSIAERRSTSNGQRPSDHLDFNRFIDDNCLVDLPLCGRKFTWYRGDGLAMSRFDRFLLSEEWSLQKNCHLPTEVYSYDHRTVGIGSYLPTELQRFRGYII
jgi:hypothetical protein